MLASPFSAPAADLTPTGESDQTAVYVVLKLDDMFAENGRVPPRWQRIADFSAQRQLKLSIGIIGNSLEGDHPEYIAGLKQMMATGRIEFWHHGYDHRLWKEGDVEFREFSGTDRAHQLDHLTRTHQLAKDKLGLTFATFGAPFNSTDATTGEVLAEMSDIKVWLYGDASSPAGKFVAHRPGPANIEAPVHKPNYAAFVKGLESELKKEPRYLVLQGHPQSWDDAAFTEFVRIVDHLVAQGYVFILPTELPDLIN